MKLKPQIADRRSEGMMGLQRQSAVGSAEHLDALEAFYEIVNSVVGVNLIGSVLDDGGSQQAKDSFKRANLYFQLVDPDAQVEHHIERLIELDRVVQSDVNCLNGHRGTIAEGRHDVRTEFDLDERSLKAGVENCDEPKSISRGKTFCEPLNASVESVDQKFLTDKLGFKRFNL